MATLKRDKSGAFILRFWTAGRGSKLVYRILGRVSYPEAKDRGRAIIADNKQEWNLADNKQERDLAGPSAIFRHLTERWHRR